MLNLFTARRERAAHMAALRDLAEAQKDIICADGPADRSRALREFADTARECEAAREAHQERPLRRDSGLCLFGEAAALAEAAAYSEQWLAEERLDGTLPGDPGELGAGAELRAWMRVFTVADTGERRRAYLDLALAAAIRTNETTVSVLGMLARAYLVQAAVEIAAANPDDGTLVTVTDPKRAAS